MKTKIKAWFSMWRKPAAAARGCRSSTIQFRLSGMRAPEMENGTSMFVAFSATHNTKKAPNMRGESWEMALTRMRKRYVVVMPVRTNMAAAASSTLRQLGNGTTMRCSGINIVSGSPRIAHANINSPKNDECLSGQADGREVSRPVGYQQCRAIHRESMYIVVVSERLSLFIMRYSCLIDTSQS
jgi:hypothetical protein